jgi:hypothetical protein
MSDPATSGSWRIGAPVGKFHFVSPVQRSIAYRLLSSDGTSRVRTPMELSGAEIGPAAVQRSRGR